MENSNEQALFGQCPKCKDAQLLNKTSVFECTGDNCDFFIFKNFNGRVLAPNEVEELFTLDEGESIEMTLTNKQGKEYNANVFFNSDLNKLYIKYEDNYLEDVECPSCQGKIKITPNGYFCENASNELPEDQRCPIVIWSPIASKEITPDIATTLLNGETTEYLKGFKGKEGKDFGAKLFLSDSTFKVEFNFERDADESLGTCPKCKKGNIFETPKAYSCDQYKQGCKYTIWKSQYGITVKEKDAIDIIENGSSKVLKLKNVKGETYEGKLYFNMQKMKMEVI